MSRLSANPAALRKTLQRQLGLCRSLIVLAEQVQEAIISGRTDRLNDLEGRQQVLILEQAEIETVRERLTREISRALGLEPVPMLSLLLPLLPAQEAAALNRLRLQMLAAQKKLAKINGRNRSLLENALEFVKFSLDALTSAALKPARYGTNLAQLSAPSFYVDSRA